MKVKVCDALCGAGKTSACINLMNDNTDKKYIFITQYLSEVERIKESCAQREFVSPAGVTESGTTKLTDINRLIADGKNIATTHALFVSYTEDIKDLIREKEYTLILDEVVDVLCIAEIAACDIEILKRSNSITETEEGVISWSNDDYDKSENGKFREEMMKAKSQNLMRCKDDCFYWSMPPELFTCFSDVYVLTYMFDAQVLRCFFDLYGIEYEFIGAKEFDGKYQFCKSAEMNRVRELKDKVHILSHKKANSVGDKRTSLSFNWYRNASAEEGAPKLTLLHNHINNVFKNVFAARSQDVLWTTFKSYEPILRGKGYSSGFTIYNKRASNEYAHKTHLAYCVNNFPRPWEVKYFRDKGVTFDGEMYALSILIQWLFRSAIRNNEEVWLYIPSARMRSLLTQWLENLAIGEDLKPVTYKTPRKKAASTKKNKEKN